MGIERIDTVVIGAGQAGIAASEHLGNANVPHLVLERDRVAERWRTDRWDSLVANGPAWHDRFPNLEFRGLAPDDFATKEQVVQYFEDYAAMISAPIRTGVDVRRVTRHRDLHGFVVETSSGVIEASRIVSATGPFQHASIPPIAPQDAAFTQLHSTEYRNPELLPPGGVLVIGAGSSGVQIADELQRAGRKVYLSVGPHDRPPRSYRNRDFTWWLGVLGEWDAPAAKPGTEHVTIAVSGAHGGHTVDFRSLAEQGVTLFGRTESFIDGTVHFLPDLADSIAAGDKNYLDMLNAADAFIIQNGLDLPEEPDARTLLCDPDCVTTPILSLDLSNAGVSTIIWATGFTVDFSWLDVNALDDNGKPIHHRGVSTASSVYFLGLPWLSRRGSSFIWGVWHDAKYVVDHITTQRKYLAYQDSLPRETGTSTSLASGAS
ncbi:MAG: NAD(P)/FAD-dependent oxidoreductase [Pseudomonadota bacterium]